MIPCRYHRNKTTQGILFSEMPHRTLLVVTVPPTTLRISSEVFARMQIITKIKPTVLTQDDDTSHSHEF
jgi:hypothetical protein